MSTSAVVTGRERLAGGLEQAAELEKAGSAQMRCSAVPSGSTACSAVPGGAVPGGAVSGGAVPRGSTAGGAVPGGVVPGAGRVWVPPGKERAAGQLWGSAGRERVPLLGRIPAGPELFAALAGVGPVERRSVDAAGVTEVMPDSGDQVLVARHWQRAMAWADSQLNAAILQIAGGRIGPEDEDWGREEVAAGLRWSGLAAAARIEVARVLNGRCFLTRRALEEGRITQRHAEEIVHALEPLDDDTAAGIEVNLLTTAETKTPAQLARSARRAVLKADPAGADARHKRARKGRRVDIAPLPDGMAELRIILPADQCASVRAQIGHLAGRMRYGGDDRTLDQRRADAVVALIEIGALTATGLVAAPPALAGMRGLRHASNPTGPGLGAVGPAGTSCNDKDVSTGTGAGSGAGARTGAGSGAGTGARTGAGSGTGSSSGAGTGARTGAGTGSGSGAGTGAGSGAGTGAASGTGTGAGSGTSTSSGMGAVSGAGAGAVAPVVDVGRAPSGVPDAKTLELIQRVLAGNRAVPPRIALTAPLSTVLGVSNSPGELTGYGPVCATIVRELAADGHWEKWITDSGGVVTDLGRSTYRPSADLARLVRATYPTCMFPGCSQPAHRCDLDHNIRRVDGGDTSAENLVAVCRRHHRAKDEGGWNLVHDPVTGVCTWTSPAGQVYTVAPPDQGDDTEALTVPSDWTAPLVPEPALVGVTAATGEDDPPPF